MNSEKSPDSFSEKILRYFKKSQHDEIRELWDQAAEADDAAKLEVTGSEKEKAFDDILSRIDSETVESTPQTAPLFQSVWFRAAAVFLVVILLGITFLSIPVQVEAPLGEFTVQTLPDGSEITLNSGSLITYNRLFGLTNRNLNLTGEAFFDVAKDDLTFTVSTHNAEIRVTGTRFNVRSWPDETDQTSVALQEGSLEFYSKTTPSDPVKLGSGQGSVVRGVGQNPSDPELITPDRAFAWTENRFSFENRPIFEIIREIERRYALNIAVSERGVLDDSLTVYYNNRVDAEQIIRDISQAKALNYREVNGGFVIE